MGGFEGAKLTKISCEILNFFRMISTIFLQISQNGTTLVAEFWLFTEMVPVLFVIFRTLPKWYHISVFKFFHTTRMVPFLLLNFGTFIKWYQLYQLPVTIYTSNQLYQLAVILVTSFQLPVIPVTRYTNYQLY